MKGSLPPLRLLSAFAAIARSGSIQVAAAELNVTQPAISQAVKQLEEHIGVRLLDRSRRPARPTAAGQTLASAISEGLGRIEDAVDYVRRAELQGAHAVTVACSVGVATYWLMSRLAAFYQANPDLTVNVITTQQGAPELSEGIDLAVRYGHGRWSDGVVTKLFEEEVEPQCAPALRTRFEGPVPLDDVSLLHVRTPEVSWMGWGDYLRRAASKSAGPPPQTAASGRGQTFTNYVQATQAALEGHGVMLGWHSITGALVNSGQLVSAGHPKVRPSDAFFLVSRAKRGARPAEVFADWLIASHGQQG
ncbi:LysR substrate-binding domain-containing protein [uncultured Roseibium sp.]|uniref:LysR family transcriptional regulator n=1 Tax=uncultured Roseibium sp. TaxID=1936171 RepID=UPI0025984F38|nr:LysR substrate-binding domain-containing protein [uncultured Roseibium sp.]